MTATAAAPLKAETSSVELLQEGPTTILTPAALEFVADLVRLARPERERLLAVRETEQARFDGGELPDFDPETEHIRNGNWRVATIPADLLDRRVEITGPVERKMVINALNSGANVFMADFEDSTAPTWDNVMAGQVNLFDAVRKTITYDHPTTGKHYWLNDSVAVLMVRPRGWHLTEKHLLVDGEAAPASVVDFSLFFFHNAEELLSSGSGPYFYLPKLQSAAEARLWNTLFVAAQKMLGVPQGSVRATVLIETLPAAFQMDEILFELRDHSAGLNCGRWDYIFSTIKTLRGHGDRVMPDRGDIGMTQPFMRAYTQRLIRTCHRRGVHAMGGMAAQIPIKGDPVANEAALQKVRDDKQREVSDGHDGTWVAHPALVALAREVFDAHMPGDHQIHRGRLDADFGRDELTAHPTGNRTLEGMRHSVRVGVQYIEAWLRGHGCVPLYNLMEDAATAEICRTQIWQWIRHGAVLDDGTPVTAALLQQVLTEELASLSEALGPERFGGSRLGDAASLFSDLCTSTTLTEFLTLPAYERLP